MPRPVGDQATSLRGEVWGILARRKVAVWGKAERAEGAGAGMSGACHAGATGKAQGTERGDERDA